METLGPYTLHETLGAGGMGVVRRAVDQRTGAVVAIKTVKVPSERLRAAMRREIAALARVWHPGVVRIVDRGVVDGMPWYAMEWVAGRPLTAWMPSRMADDTWWTTTLDPTTPVPAPERDVPEAPSAPFDPTGPVRWIRALCAPLGWLHGEGFVHRDLKPANVLVRPDGRLVIVDFGLSWRNLDVRDRLDVGELRAGSPLYMAPEQIRGELVDARTDLYALGCLLYEAVTGTPPHGGATAAEVLGSHLRGAPPPVQDLVPDAPPALCELVHALLQPDRRARVGHAEEVERVLAGLGVPDPGWRDAPAARPVLYRPGFVGRAEPLARVDAALEAGSGAIWLEGDSGIGKTRLALEALARAQVRGTRTLVASCTEVAFRPLEPLREALALGAMALGRAEAVPRTEELHAHQSHVVLSAAVEAVSALGLGRPTLLLVDDLQWADPLTVAVLERLAARAPAGLVLLGTARPSAAPDRLTRLPGHHERLDALADEDVSAIVGEVLARYPAPPELVDVVRRAARGNPFLAAECVRLAVVERFLLRVDGHWEVDPTQRFDGVTDVLRRIRRLDAGPLAVARALAVVGRPVPTDAAREIADLPEADFDAAVHELARRAVVEDTGATLAIAHDRLREALTALVGPHAAALHRRAALALGRSGAAGSEVAQHWERVGEDVEAARCHVRAARDALALGDHREGSRAFERALTLAPQVDEAIEWAGEYLDLTIEMFPNDDVRSRLAHLVSRLDALGLPEDHPRRWRTHVAALRLGLRSGDPTEAARRARLAQRTASTPAQQARADRLAVDVERWRGEPPAIERLRGWIASARIAGDRIALATALWHAAKNAVHGGDPAEVAAWVEEALAVYRDVGAEVDVAHLLNLQTETARRRGDLGTARTAALEAHAIFARHDMPVAQADQLNVLGDLDRQEGHLESAVDRYGAALAAYRALGHYGAEIAELNLAIAQAEVGSFQASRAATDALIERFRASKRLPLEAMTRVAQLPALAGLQDWDALAAQLAHARDQLEASGFTDADVPRSAWYAHELARDAGKAGLARDLARLAFDHADRTGATELAERARAASASSSHSD